MMTNKLRPRFSGPYKIKAQLQPSVYELDLSSVKTKVNPVVNITHLKPFIAPKDYKPGAVAVFELDDGEQAFYELDRVLKHRITRKGKLQYLVSWKNYGSSYDEWLNEEDLSQFAVDGYWEKQQVSREEMLANLINVDKEAEPKAKRTKATQPSNTATFEQQVSELMSDERQKQLGVDNTAETEQREKQRRHTRSWRQKPRA